MQKLIIIVAILLFPIQALCADVPLQWNVAPGATSYKIQMSTDSGITWPTERVVSSGTAFTWLGAPETGLVLFRAVAVNAQRTTIRTDAGVWYNKLWQLPTAVGSLGAN